MLSTESRIDRLCDSTKIKENFNEPRDRRLGLRLGPLGAET